MPKGRKLSVNRPKKILTVQDIECLLEAETVSDNETSESKEVSLKESWPKKPMAFGCVDCSYIAKNILNFDTHKCEEHPK